jgi:hypothetical protein
VPPRKIEWAEQMVELWNAREVERFLDEIADFTLVVWWDGSEAEKPSRMAAFFDHREAVDMRAATLADWPVIVCMLFKTRLGCLKKPTEEARGG